MDIGDMILEGVKNSIEAGASDVKITVTLEKDDAEILIEDNGISEIPSDPFAQGTTTKGTGRGYGLYHVYLLDPKAELMRENGITYLSFRGRADASFSSFDELLIPVFMQDAELISFTFNNGSRSFHIEQSGIPNSVRAIAAFRAMVRKKEFEMSKLTLDDLHRIRETEQEKLKKRDIHGKDIHIVVAMGTSGIAAGAKVVLNAIADELEKAGCDDVILTQSGSAGDYPEPFVEVYSKDKGLVAYSGVTRDDAVRIVREHIMCGKVLSDKRAVVKEE